MSTDDAGTDATPEPTHEDRLAEASALLVPEEAPEGPEGEEQQAQAEDAPGPGEAEQESEPETEQVTDEETAPPADEVPTKARIMQMKRYRQQADRKLNEMKDLEEQLGRREQALQEQARAVDLLAKKLRNDPIAAIDDLAARAGLDSNQVYERLTRRHLNNGSPDASELQHELHALRADIDKERKQRAEDERRALEQVRAQTIDRNIQQDSTLIANIGASDQRESYPYLSAMDPKEVAGQARTIIRTVLDSGMQMSLEQIAGFIDKEAKSRYDQLSRALSSNGDGHPQEGGNGSGQGSLARGAKLGKRSRKPRAVTNSHSAETSGSARELSQAEKLARADELLRSLVPSGD